MFRTLQTVAMTFEKWYPTVPKQTALNKIQQCKLQMKTAIYRRVQVSGECLIWCSKPERFGYGRHKVRLAWERCYKWKQVLYALEKNGDRWVVTSLTMTALWETGDRNLVAEAGQRATAAN